MTDELQLASFTVEDVGGVRRLRIELHNPRTVDLHAYEKLRGAAYDPVTRHLVLLFTEDGLGDDAPATSRLLPPHLIAIAPGETVALGQDLPRVMTRLAGPVAGSIAPHREELPIHDALTIEVRVGWSDRPFYVDPRRQEVSLRAQLKAWHVGVLRGRATLPTR